MVMVVEEEIDLFKTFFSGSLSVEIENLGKLEVDSVNQEEPLAFFATNVSVFLTREPQILNYGDSPWEIVSFSREKRELVLKKKN